MGIEVGRTFGNVFAIGFPEKESFDLFWEGLLSVPTYSYVAVSDD